MDPWLIHGGRLGEACRRFGGVPAEWLDLSTGINPCPWPVPADLAIDWAALPDEGALAVLEAVAAASFGVDPRFVCALPGTEIGLRLVSGVIGVGNSVRAWPSYGTHAAALPGSRAVERGTLAEAARAGASIILANPNNPDGSLMAPAALLDLARIAERASRWLIVDEAFADVDPGWSVVSQVGAHRSLVLFRSFGKFFGLAGVRLGFVIGPEDVIAGFRRLLGAWPVSAAAVAIGTAAYRDVAWVARTRSALVAQARALDAVLERHGYRVSGECPLFRLSETAHAASLFDRLARRHILTRPFDYRPDWLRIGLPRDAAALARLDEALREA